MTAENSLNILENDRICAFFVKANNFLFCKFENSFQKKKNKEELLKILWKKEFKAKLIKIEGVFTKVVFRSQSDLSIFRIKFF